MSLRELGLAADADERDVRRAYARLLKQNRPDDDAVAFQRLHEAYERALAQVRQRALATDDDDVDEVDENDGMDAGDAVRCLDDGEFDALIARSDALLAAPAAVEPDDVRAAAPPDFAYDDFVDELLQHAREKPAADLAAWLTAHPALFSLALKASLAVPVLQAAAAQEPPLPAPALDAIAGFFGIDGPGRRHAWLHDLVEHARRRAATAQMFADRRLPPSPGRPGGETVWFDGVIDDEIASPRWPGLTPLLLIVPGVPTRMANRIDEIDGLTRGAADEFVDPRRRRVVALLADRARIGLDRIGLTLLRALLFGGFFLGVAALLSPRVDPAAVVAVAAFTALALLWQLTIAAWLRLQRAASGRGRGGWLRIATVLAMVGCAALIGAWRGGAGLAPYSFAIGALLYAAGRARIGRALGLGLLLALADLALLTADSPLRPLPPGLAGLCAAALAVLAGDAWLARREQVPLEAVWLDQRAIHRLTVVASGLVVAAIVLRNLLK